MTVGYRCAEAALRRGDPMLATASVTRRWLLLEEPGGWGFDGITTSPVDRDVARTVAARAERAGVRVQLIRRPGRRRNRPGERRVALVHSDPGAEQSWWSSIRTDAELLDLRLDEPPTGWTATREPVYLVCTHGRKDVCCALWGRPVADQLAAHRPDATWETSHVGGDRFAANLVVLPHGLYYGRLSPDTALAAAKAYEEGRVLPPLLRGRTAYATPVQAAEHFARAELAETRLDGLTPRELRQLDPTTWRVALLRDGGPVEVTVRAVASPLPAQLTCANQHATHYRTYELVGLRVGRPPVDPAGAP